jgi:putative endonuclease
MSCALIRLASAENDAVIPSAARDLARVNSERSYYVYLLSSDSRVLYVGCTSDLVRRMYQHRHGLLPGLTREYRVRRLVHFEVTPNAAAAVAREREIKGWRRAKKIRLIEQANAGWLDIATDWLRE